MPPFPLFLIIMSLLRVKLDAKRYRRQLLLDLLKNQGKTTTTYA